MPLVNTINTADSVPNTGENSVEHSSEAVFKICGAVVGDFGSIFNSVSKSNIPDLLVEQGSDIANASKALGSFNSKVKSKSADRLANSFLEQGVDEDELLLISGLGKALISTAHYLLVVDPSKEINPATKTAEYRAETAKAGAKANIDWLDFFIKTKRRFDYLSNEDMLQIFNSTMGSSELRRVFASRVSDSFPIGVFAALGAYLKLDEGLSVEERNQGIFRVPTQEQDTAGSIDLIWESRDSSVILTKYYEIKSGPESFGFRAVDIMDPFALEELKKDINLQIKPDRGLNYISSIEKLRRTVIAEERDTVKGYIVFVPIG